MSPMTEAMKKAQKKYNATHTKMYSFKLNVKTDADLIERISEVGGVQGYIKRLIREDIERSKTE